MLSDNGLLVAFTLTFKQEKTHKTMKFFSQSKDFLVGRPSYFPSKNDKISNFLKSFIHKRGRERVH